MVSIARIVSFTALAVASLSSAARCQSVVDLQVTSTELDKLSLHVTSTEQRVMIDAFISVEPFAVPKWWHYYWEVLCPPAKSVIETPTDYSNTLSPLASQFSQMTPPGGYVHTMPSDSLAEILGQLTSWSLIEELTQPLDSNGSLHWESKPTSWYAANQPEPVIPWRELTHGSSTVSDTTFSHDVLARHLLARQISRMMPTPVLPSDPVVTEIIDSARAGDTELNFNFAAIALNPPVHPATKPIVTISLVRPVRVKLPPDVTPPVSMVRLPQDESMPYLYPCMAEFECMVELAVAPTTQAELDSLIFAFPGLVDGELVLTPAQGTPNETLVRCWLPAGIRTGLAGVMETDGSIRELATPFPTSPAFHFDFLLVQTPQS